MSEYDYMGCPIHEPCPPDMDLDCGYTYPSANEDHCPPPPMCIPSTYQGVKGNQCSNFCPPVRNETSDDVWCSGGVDWDGCYLPDFFVPAGTECPPPLFDER